MYKRHHRRVSSRNRGIERQRQEEMKIREVAVRGPYQGQTMKGSIYGFPNHFTQNQDHCYGQGYGYPGYRHSGYSHQGYRQPGYGHQGYRHPGWPAPRSMHYANSHDWKEIQRRQELEMMPEFASEEAFKAKMMEGIDQSDPVNTTRVQTMRAACESLFSKLNRQLGKIVNQIKETDLYAELMNVNCKRHISELHHKFGSEFAAFNLENEKRNMAYGVVSNEKKSKRYIADLEYQLVGKSNPLRLRKKKKFEDIDFISGVQNTRKSNNPFLNLVKKWEKI